MKSHEQDYKSKMDLHTSELKKLQADHDEEIKAMKLQMQEIEKKSLKNVSSLEDLLQVTKDALQRETERAEVKTNYIRNLLINLNQTC